MDLLFPRGLSVNDNVNTIAFDHDAFILKFPGIDNIVETIISMDDPYLAKIDVARAFRNLRVDPADALKFGIFWKGNYYVDVALAFSWFRGVSENVRRRRFPYEKIRTYNFCLY